MVSKIGLIVSRPVFVETTKTRQFNLSMEVATEMPTKSYLSFRLPDSFLEDYKDKTPEWGFPIGGGNSLSEMIFITKYSRLKENGEKERWWEVCQRCIEGYYSILKDSCVSHRTPWNEYKAQRSAIDAYQRMFVFKWLPPGRGLWAMGTEIVNGEQNSAPLYNCSGLSTEKLSSHSASEATLPFVRLMEMSMNGIGVGFDTRGAGKLTLNDPTEEIEVHVIGDTREAWCKSLGTLLESYFFKNRKTVEFDYSLIRSEGTPLKRFGGVASGPAPLMEMHEKLGEILSGRAGEPVSSRDIVDICNISAKAAVAGGTRRSALLALGFLDDSDFINLKDIEVFPERNGHDGWGWASNNTVFADLNDDLSGITDAIGLNGEPGLLFLDLARSYGRIVDGPDYKDMDSLVANPCCEILLSNNEVCNLNEIFPNHHDNLDDLKRTIKHAYLYSKAVTLLPTPWPETNQVVQRNRRIGCSMSGLAQFVESRGWTTLREWMNEGYKEVSSRDKQYSEWLGVRESIRMTTVKPSGTVSIIAGATPGVHWPVAAGVYIRRVRFSTFDPIVDVLREAGYPIEADVMNPKTTVVVEFPTQGPDMRSDTEVSIWEKAELASLAQRWWADNMVSCTINFQEEERSQVPAMIAAKTGHMKVMSLLPPGGAYEQMPFERMSPDKAEKMRAGLKKIDWEKIYASGGSEAEGEKFCTTDTCLV